MPASWLSFFVNGLSSINTIDEITEYMLYTLQIKATFSHPKPVNFNLPTMIYLLFFHLSDSSMSSIILSSASSSATKISSGHSPKASRWSSEMYSRPSLASSSKSLSWTSSSFCYSASNNFAFPWYWCARTCHSLKFSSMWTLSMRLI